MSDVVRSIGKKPRFRGSRLQALRTSFRWCASTVLMAVGCGGTDAVTPSNVDARVGTYGLQTMYGNILPRSQILTGGTTSTLNGGIIILRADGTFTRTLDFVQTRNGVTTSNPVIASGTYSFYGDSVRYVQPPVTAPAGNILELFTVGRLTGQTLTWYSGDDEVYTKRP